MLGGGARRAGRLTYGAILGECDVADPARSGVPLALRGVDVSVAGNGEWTDILADTEDGAVWAAPVDAPRRGW